MVRLVVWLILFLLLLAATIRSFVAADVVALTSVNDGGTDFSKPMTGRGVLVRPRSGGVTVEWRDATQSVISSQWVLPPPPGINTGFPDGRYDLSASGDLKWSFAGFAFASGSRSSARLWSVRHWSLQVPATLIVCTLAAAGMTLRQFRRHRSTSTPGLCTACGYDLRASKDRCPECGRPITHSAQLPHPLPAGHREQSANRP